MGAWSLTNLERGGYTGDIYLVNPAYTELKERRCYAALSELPEVPDLLIFAVADHRIEAVLDEAINLGVPAAVLMSSLNLDEDTVPALKARVQKKAADAGMLVCGANGMGYYNVRDKVWACGFDSTEHTMPGNVAIISHSGSGMSGIIDCEARLRINFAVSTGNEISVCMDEYLDFVLDLPETRVVGLFVETARNPAGFRAALEKARHRRIPIVALKTGRTETAAQLTLSHSGAMAGDDATYDALFERYGVQRVYDQDEWATTLIMFAELHPVGPGGLVTLHDSGGERQLLVDLADAAGVQLAELAPATLEALSKILPPELPAVNPLDAWSRGGDKAGDYMAECFALLLSDPGAALGAVLHDRAPYGKVYASYLDYMKIAYEKALKPVALVAARQGTGHDAKVVSSTHNGFPVLDGVRSFLTGVNALFNYRDYLSRELRDIVPANSMALAAWRKRLAAGGTLGEAESLALLDDFEIAAARPVAATSADAAVSAATLLNFPVVLKSAQPGLLHKTEQNGVVLNIRDEQELRRAYAQLDEKLGPDVLVAPMITDGVELFLGAKADPQFGPIVVLGFGGILAETIGDVVFALPPFDASDAHRYLARLKLRPVLDGVRGRPSACVDAFCRMAARFSVMVHELGGMLKEVDVNPVIVTENSAIAVDALFVLQ